jgi:hypothetical protein
MRPPTPNANRTLQRLPRRAPSLNYEATLAALNDLLAEIREERRQAETSSKVVDAQHGQEQATTHPANVWVEAHAALSRI